MASFVAETGEEVRELVNEAVRISGLGKRLSDKIKTYSKGMKRRLLVARALMVKPKVAILDEPTAGLDVIHAVHVRKIVKEHAQKYGIAVLLSSHNMLEVEYLCNRIALINRGKILVEGNPLQLKDHYGALNLEEVFAMVVSKHG